MSDRPPEEDDALRWRREASEELRATEVVAARVAGFHAHSAAEKALKSLLIELGIEVPRIHDLIGLHLLLSEALQDRFDAADCSAIHGIAGLPGRSGPDFYTAGRSDTRTSERNGSRPRLFATQAGDVELWIPELGEGSFFPSILGPRRRIDQALYALVMEVYVAGVWPQRCSHSVRSTRRRHRGGDPGPGDQVRVTASRANQPEVAHGEPRLRSPATAAAGS